MKRDDREPPFANKSLTSLLVRLYGPLRLGAGALEELYIAAGSWGNGMGMAQLYMHGVLKQYSYTKLCVQS